MKRIVIRPNGQTGFVIELMVFAGGRERVDQRTSCADIEVARRIAGRWSTMNGGCRIEDRTIV